MLKEKSEFLKDIEDSPFWVDELAGNLRYFEFDYVRCNYYLIYNETERKYNIMPWEDETYTFLYCEKVCGSQKNAQRVVDEYVLKWYNVIIKFRLEISE